MMNVCVIVLRAFSNKQTDVRVFAVFTTAHNADKMPTVFTVQQPTVVRQAYEEAQR